MSNESADTVCLLLSDQVHKFFSASVDQSIGVPNASDVEVL